MQELNIFLVKGTVVLLLKDGQLYLDECLFLRRDALLNIFLQSAQNVRADSFVQLVDPVLAFDIAISLQKAIQVIEAIGINNIQQCPHLLHVVLDGRSGEEEDGIKVEPIVAQILSELR